MVWFDVMVYMLFGEVLFRVCSSVRYLWWVWECIIR